MPQGAAAFASPAARPAWVTVGLGQESLPAAAPLLSLAVALAGPLLAEAAEAAARQMMVRVPQVLMPEAEAEAELTRMMACC